MSAPQLNLPDKLLHDMYSRCNVISFFFAFLSIILMESVKHLISNGDSRLSFSISLSLEAHDDGIYMHTCTKVRFVCLYVIFSSSCYFFFLLSFSFSLLIISEREKERHINRGRWWRAHCWFFPSFYSCVCILSMLWEGTWFESRLDRSLFFFSGKVHRSVV